MSGQLRVDEITDELGTGAPSFPQGLPAGDLTGNVAAARITDALNATGSAPIYACRAWVNFDGTGTVAIRESGNVSSITDNTTGDYTVNFTTAMEDVNYAVGGSAEGTQPYYMLMRYSGGTTTTSVRIRTGEPGASYNDVAIVNVAIFR